MKKILFSFLIALVLVGCDEEDIERANRVSFENEQIEVKVPADAVDYQQTVKVYTSTVSGSARQFPIVVDEDGTTVDSSIYSLPTSVTIPADSNVGEFDLTISDIGITFDVATLALEFDTDSGVFSGSTVLNISELCEDTIVNLTLNFDGFAEEAVWELYDLSVSPPAVIATGGAGGAYTDLDNSSLTVDFCLPSGGYGIIVYDTYGDGGTGYVVTDANGTTLSSGTTPDAGGGYPVLTQDTDTFNIN
ncbi:hypothetical protein [Winogradskyella luteola]|uniref:Uncharacterized protein n=1 Tax=Winogradskyella luteola TaxID=2828330 RepID=A0A9X1FCK3_9FLAO|nr:hypothetical protein [Winogradskyella luteola]MBV7270598.1 hypothetical protein [Winogradskyella luteola]